MASLSQNSVTLAAPDAQRLLGRMVHQVAAPNEQEQSTAAFNLVGWVVGRQAPVERVELWQTGKVVQAAAVGDSRPNVAKQFPGTAWAADAGFLMTVDSLDYDTAIDGELRAVLDDGLSVPLAVIEGRSQRFPPADAQNLQPLAVTSLARSGSTWLMRLLAEHPEIVAFRRYPYEMRPALYWTHMLKVLSEPPARSKPIAHPKTFFRDAFAVGANPFHTSALQEYPPLQEWSETAYLTHLASFCYDSIESWYRQVAIGQGQSNAAYFAEKRHPAEHPGLLWNMYPGMREIFLLRDFRDVASSALAFNAQRGREGFGRQHVASDEEFLVSLSHAGTRLLQHWTRQSARSHLVRYEELVTSPSDTLRAMLIYIGVDASSATIDGMIERASRESPELQQHQTSGSSASSIGRWRRDLDPALQAVASDVFSDLLARFDYDQDA